MNSVKGLSIGALSFFVQFELCSAHAQTIGVKLESKAGALIGSPFEYGTLGGTGEKSWRSVSQSTHISKYHPLYSRHFFKQNKVGFGSCFAVFAPVFPRALL